MAWPKRTWWTPERARERGRVGGKASGAVRGKNRHTADYKRGYQAGWKASERWFRRLGLDRQDATRRARAEAKTA